MMDNLLEQRGEKVEAFMEEHDSVRWKREIQTAKYEKVREGRGRRGETNGVIARQLTV